MADTNGDGRADFIIGYTTPFPRSSVVYVWLQQADGTFVENRFYEDVTRCNGSDDERFEAHAMLDVDRNGKSDLLVTTNIHGLGGPPSGLSLLSGTSGGLGSGRCVASASSSQAGFPVELSRATRLRTGDFDGDGQQDLAALLDGSFQRLRLFRGEGPSKFVPVGSQGFYAYRLFQDHLPSRSQDHLMTFEATRTELKLSRISFDSVEGFAPPVEIATVPQGYGPSAGVVLDGFSISDFNADGLTDVFVLGNQEQANQGAASFSLVCDRSAQWETASGQLASGTQILAAADVDGDGRAELVARSGTDLVILGFVD
jgi:hypothetical protein